MMICFDAPFVELPKAIRPISLRKRLSKRTQQFDVVISCEYLYSVVLNYWSYLSLVLRWSCEVRVVGWLLLDVHSFIHFTHTSHHITSHYSLLSLLLQHQLQLLYRSRTNSQTRIPLSHLLHPRQEGHTHATHPRWCSVRKGYQLASPGIESVQQDATRFWKLVVLQ